MKIEALWKDLFFMTKPNFIMNSVGSNSQWWYSVILETSDVKYLRFKDKDMDLESEDEDKYNDRGVLNQGVMSGGLRPPVLKFSCQNPLSCSRKWHRTLCSNSTGGYVLGVLSGLATDRGFWPRGVMSVAGFCPPIPNRASAA